MQKVFSKREALKTGWYTTVNNIGLLTKVALALFGVWIVFGILDLVLRDYVALNTLVSIVSVVVSFSLSLGLIYISLSLVRGESTQVRDLVSQNKYLLRFIGSSILVVLILIGALLVVGVIGYGLAQVTGFDFTWGNMTPLHILLFIIFGILALGAFIWVSLRYSMVIYTILDEDKGVLDSLKRSAELTSGSIWNLFLLQVLFILLGIIAFFVGFILGVFLIYSISFIALAYVYERLRLAHGGNVPMVKQDPELPAERDDVSPQLPAEAPESEPLA